MRKKKKKNNKTKNSNQRPSGVVLTLERLFEIERTEDANNLRKMSCFFFVFLNACRYRRLSGSVLSSLQKHSKFFKSRDESLERS